MTPLRSQRARVLSGLGQRDMAVLKDLARVRLLSGRHIQRLHVHEGSTLTQARRCRALLQRLHDLHLVARMDRRIGGMHAGSAGYVYGLATLGQRLVSGVGPAGGRRLRLPWNARPEFTDHIMAVSELYVGLRELERDGQLELLAFDAEPAVWRTWQGEAGGQLVLKPDAFVATAVGDVEYLTFVELDRSTQSMSVIRRKAEAYTAYWRSGQEQARQDGVFPKVLFAVLDERRRALLVDALGRLDPDTWRLFQVATQAEAGGALSDRSPPGEDTNSHTSSQ